MCILCERRKTENAEKVRDSWQTSGAYKKRLDFSKYPGMRSAVRVLINFTKQKTVNMQTMRSLNKLIELLVIIENDYVQYRRGLAYRFIRLFIVLVLYGNFVNAAVVADFILNQLITKEDYK